MKLKDLVTYLDEHLQTKNFYSDISQNGLQVEGNPVVKKIVCAVDACMDTFVKTKEQKGQLLLVHHGLFWQKSLLITGVHRERLAYLLKNNISLYASHLPLDAHPEQGNNAVLAKLLKLKISGPFGFYRNTPLGVETLASKAIDRDKLVAKVETLLNEKGRFLGYGAKKVRRIAILSGSGASMLDEVVAGEYDFFITGEGNHPSFHTIKENKLNVLYAGHYATETLGVKALAKHIEQKFNIPFEFVGTTTGF